MTRGGRLLSWNLVLLLQGRAVSQLGSAVAQVAILFWVLEATRSATAMGVVAMAGALPAALFGMVGGVYADRLNKKWTLVCCDAVIGVALIAAAIVFFAFADRSPMIVLGALAGASVVTGTAGALFYPALQAAIPIAVPTERLHQANSLFGFVASTAQVIGQALGGVLYRVLGAPLVVLVNGCAFLISAVTEMLLRLPERRRSESRRAPVLRELSQGLGYIALNAGLRNMYLLFAVWFFLNAPNVILLPILVSEYHQATPDWLGYMFAALGLGGLVGAAAMSSFTIDGRARLAWFTGAGVYLGVMLAVLGQTATLIAGVVITFAAGLAMPVINILVATIIQATTPRELIGRVSSVGMTISAATLPVGYLFWGVVIDVLERNAPLILAANGALMALAVAAFAMASMPYRRFLSTSVSEATAAPEPAGGS